MIIVLLLEADLINSVNFDIIDLTLLQIFDIIDLTFLIIFNIIIYLTFLKNFETFLEASIEAFLQIIEIIDIIDLIIIYIIAIIFHPNFSLIFSFLLVNI